jgi:hypothetical protein
MKLRLTAWASLRSARPTKYEKRKREAERRQTRIQPPHRRQVYAVCANHLLGCGSVLDGARSPVGVPPRLCLTGFRPLRAAPGQASWDVAGTCDLLLPFPGEERTQLVRALPAPTCPSPVAAPHRPLVVAVRMMPKAARERSVSFRARAPHSLRTIESTLAMASLTGARLRGHVTEMGTRVNKKVTTKCRRLTRKSGKRTVWKGIVSGRSEGG